MSFDQRGQQVGTQTNVGKRRNEMQTGYQKKESVKFEDSDARYMKPLMVEIFTIGEIRDLIFALGEDSEVIASGETNKSRLIQVTLQWFSNRGRLHEAWNAVAKVRPFLNWATTDGSVAETPVEEEVVHANDLPVGEEWELLTELSRINMRIMEISSQLMKFNIQRTKE